MNQTETLRAALRAQEEKRGLLFSERAPFSAHLRKWKDALLPDMHDHNTFEMLGVPEETELLAARKRQLAAGAGFWKLEGDEPLPPELTRRYSLAESCTLTMALEPGAHSRWRRNASVTIADIQERDITADLLALELRNYGAVYGEDFTEHKTNRYCGAAKRDDRFHYFGAYMSGRIAGACWAFCSDGYTGIDGLLVDSDARGQYVATTLLAGVAERLGGCVYLHADRDDTPRQMYANMGFRTVDELYEYFCDL